MIARRKSVALVLALLVVLIGGAISYRLFQPKKTNVILITLDTTRADRLGIYGYEKGETKPFDDFAKTGVVFERAYAPSPVTLPSHTTMLTGLYPPEHDLRTNGSGRLSSKIPFLPQILKDNGFETGAFIAAAVLGSQYGLNRGFDHYDDGPPRKVQVPRHAHEPRRDGSEIVDLALDWLKGRTEEKPFFCWVHLYDAHAPYDARADLFADRFAEQPYDAGVAWELKQIERIRSHLKERELDENTLIVIAGDHGEGLMEHHENEHGMLVYNSTLHVPLIFIGTPDCKAETRVSSAVSLVDLMPTVLELLHLPVPEKISGRSLASALSGGSIEPRDCYAETETPFAMNRWSPMQTVISDQWKFIASTKPELFDLENDPGELNNLLDSSPEKRDQLQGLLAEMKESFVRFGSEDAKLTEKDLANLRTLGYVDGGSQSKSTNDPEQSKESLPDVKDFLPQLSAFEDAKHLAVERKIEPAIGLLKGIVEQTKQFPAAELLLGDCLAQSGKLADAERIYRSVVREHSHFTRAHQSLGRVLLGQNQPEEALVEFQNFVNANPDSAVAHAELGQILAQLGKPEDAMPVLQKALLLDPTLVAARNTIGQIQLAVGRPVDAINSFSEVLRTDEDNAMAHGNLMILYSQSGQIQRAISHGARTVELAPEIFEFRYNYGLLLASQKQTAEALKELKAAEKLRPNVPNLRTQIEQLESQLNR